MGSTTDQITPDVPVGLPNLRELLSSQHEWFPLLAISTISELSQSRHRTPEEPLAIKIEASKSGHNGPVGYHDGRVQPPAHPGLHHHDI